jgi:glycine/D-amino acid oxidase-like deaminating enzyme
MHTDTGDVFMPVQKAARIDFQPLPGDVSCEIAVVGGGISGALVAWELAEAEADVVVVDRGGGGQGSTAATTGLLMYELDTSMVELAGRYGEAAAARMYQLTLAANGRFSGLTRDIGDCCELLPRSSLYLASSPADVPALEAEYAIRRRHGFALELLEPDEILGRFGFSRPAALLNHDAFEIDARRLTQGLFRTAIGRGLRAYGNCDVLGYEPAGEGVSVHCAKDRHISAKRVVFATGYHTARYIGRPIGQLMTTYTIKTQPMGEVSGWERRTMIWETARPYFYVRDTADGRAICGGGDEPGTDPARRVAALAEKSHMLRGRFEDLFPSAHPKIDRAWASTFGTSKDGMPFIGTLTDFPRAYFSLGFGGNGITFSLIAAEIIRDLYTGKANGDARLFRFDR